MRRVMVVLPLVAAAGCADGFTRYEYGGIRMGARARIVVWSKDADQARMAGAAALARMDELDGVLSDWRVDGPVAQLRDATPGTWLSIPRDMALVLETAHAVGDCTQGAFDVTWGRLTTAWRASRPTGRLPDAASTAAARAASGWSHLDLGADDRIRFVQAVPWLDFGGIGKGFAVDEALAVLAGHGCTRALVDLGGDLAMGHPPPGRTGWRIVLPDGRILMLRHCGVATSGMAHQHIDDGPRRWSHVLDPRTGTFVPDHPDITVVAPTAAMADALASAACVLGVEPMRACTADLSGVQIFDVLAPD